MFGLCHRERKVAGNCQDERQTQLISYQGQIKKRNLLSDAHAVDHSTPLHIYCKRKQCKYRGMYFSSVTKSNMLLTKVLCVNFNIQYLYVMVKNYIMFFFLSSLTHFHHLSVLLSDASLSFLDTFPVFSTLLTHFFRGLNVYFLHDS